MTLDDWRKMRRPVSQWRARARSVMLDVVESLAIMAPDLLGAPAEVLSRVDAAYPFGEREHHPYKAWLAERKLLRLALADAPEPPSREEADVCMVARDLFEEGRVDEARKLIVEHAPNRLARECPSCGAPSGEDCHDFVERWEIGTTRPFITVPHEARLTGHLDAGPLFGARQ